MSYDPNLGFIEVKKKEWERRWWFLLGLFSGWTRSNPKI